MNKLDHAIANFCSIFGREGYDTGLLSQQDALKLDIPIELPRSADLINFYHGCGIAEKIYIGGDLMLELESPQTLLRAQFGWRWISDKTQVNVLNPAWKDSWIVIGNRNGDALIIDTSFDGGPIYGAIQREYFKISNSLSQFIELYADWMRCEYTEFNMEGTDDDFNIKPEFMARLMQIASSKANNECVNGFKRYFFA